MAAFAAWCKSNVQLDRSERYASGSQDVTVDKQRDHILSFMGFLVKFRHEQRETLSLELYEDVEHVSQFLAFLIARRGGASHVTKHIYIARKVLDFLMTRTASHATRQHMAKMDAWLSRLSNSLRKALPRPEPPYIPSLEDCFGFVRRLGEKAMDALKMDRARFGRMRAHTARLLHDAILVNIMTGYTVPPPRMSIIKTVLHPRYHAGAPRRCPHTNCGDPTRCKSNRFEMTRTGECNHMLMVFHSYVCTHYMCMHALTLKMCMHMHACIHTTSVTHELSISCMNLVLTHTVVMMVVLQMLKTMAMMVGHMMVALMRTHAQPMLLAVTPRAPLPQSQPTTVSACMYMCGMV